MIRDYTTVTEVPGLGATGEQLARLYHRYNVAYRYCRSGRVLEVACGTGFGLGYLARAASCIVGGDYTGSLVRIAQDHYRGRIPLLQLDAHALPFQDASFDTLVLFEALYYLRHPDHFLEEARRVLSEEGVLVICTVNREWADFNPSRFSNTYFSARELSTILRRHGFEADIFGAFPVTLRSPSQKALSMIKRAAVSLRLIPPSMKGKEWLKRVFCGRLTPLPAELERDSRDQVFLTPISDESPTSEYKILYAVGGRR